MCINYLSIQYRYLILYTKLGGIIYGSYFTKKFFAIDTSFIMGFIARTVLLNLIFLATDNCIHKFAQAFAMMSITV